IRWSGLALMLGGALTAIPMLFHPNELADPSSMLSPAWAPIHTAIIFGLVLSLFGLVGAYARQSENTGLVGFGGFALSFVGSALFVAVITIDAYVIPAIVANGAEALLAPDGPLFNGPLGLVFLLSGVVFALGTLLLGFATARAGALPRWAGVALIVGGPLLGFSGTLPHIASVIAGLLVGISYIGLGYRLFAAPQDVAMKAHVEM
ncbi:MAG: hypothetical protein AAB217_09890, partial [Chloroflexota bacterium]